MKQNNKTIYMITSNAGKIKEMTPLLEPIGLVPRQLHFEYPEIQADSLRDVAIFGMNWLVNQLSNKITGHIFLDDSGLFVDALSGFPGVYSAYALGTIGYEGILELMRDVAGAGDRGAHFETCIAYMYIPGDDDEYDAKDEGVNHPLLFTGRCDGYIALRPRGSHGFGFDPIFCPKLHDTTEHGSGTPDEIVQNGPTFAEMARDDKNRISHRGRALNQLIDHLEKKIN